MLSRRDFAKSTAGFGLGLGLALPFISSAKAASPKVVVIGGGYGGATAAKYIRLFSKNSIAVTLIEPNKNIISCPVSNLVISGDKTMTDITLDYTKLVKNHGIDMIHDEVQALDVAKKTIALKGGQTLSYDKCVLSPGIDFTFDKIENLAALNQAGKVLHAWKAGTETIALRQQLEAMEDGGVFAIAIPLAPYRCPPGPYERASMVASYFKRHKPKSKVIIIDENPDITSKAALFKQAWAKNYAGMIDYRPNLKLEAVDGLTMKFAIDENVKATVLNVLPEMSAAKLARQAGLATVNNRWCGVNYLTFQSLQSPDVHVIGDSMLPAPAMAKSGHMASSQAKIVAAAIVSMAQGQAVNPNPILINTCYSYVSEKEAIHVASVHGWVEADKTIKILPNASGVSANLDESEFAYAESWAKNIWQDSFG